MRLTLSINLPDIKQPLCNLLAVACLSLVCATSVLAAKPNKDKVPVESSRINSTILVLSEQPLFMIGLPANPTTGYVWTIHDYDQELLTTVKHEYKTSSKGRMGAPGTDVWTFKMNPKSFARPQRTNLTMIYARPSDVNGDTSVVKFEIVTKQGQH